jgi:hypothetical protein
MSVDTSKRQSASVTSAPAKAAFWQFGSYESLLQDTKYSRWMTPKTQDNREDVEDISRGDEESTGARETDALESSESIVNAPSEELQSESIESIVNAPSEELQSDIDCAVSDESMQKALEKTYHVEDDQLHHDKVKSRNSAKSMFDEILDDDDVTDASIKSSDVKEKDNGDTLEPLQSKIGFGLPMSTSLPLMRSDSPKPVQISPTVPMEQKSPLSSSWGGFFGGTSNYFSSVFQTMQRREDQDPDTETQGSILQKNTDVKAIRQEKRVQWDASVEIQIAQDHESSLWDMLDNLFVHADLGIAGIACAGDRSDAPSRRSTDTGEKRTIVDEWMSQTCCAASPSKMSGSHLIAREERALVTKSSILKSKLMDELASNVPTMDCKEVDHWIAITHRAAALPSIPECSESMTNGMTSCDALAAMNDGTLGDTSITSTITSSRDTALFSDMPSEAGSGESQTADDSSQCSESKVNLVNTLSCGNLNSISFETPTMKNLNVSRIHKTLLDITARLPHLPDTQLVEQRPSNITFNQKEESRKNDPPASLLPAFLGSDPPASLLHASLGSKEEKKSLSNGTDHVKTLKQELAASSANKGSIEGSDAPASSTMSYYDDAPFSPLVSNTEIHQDLEAPPKQQMTTKKKPLDPPPKQQMTLKKKPLDPPAATELLRIEKSRSPTKELSQPEPVFTPDMSIAKPVVQKQTIIQQKPTPKLDQTMMSMMQSKSIVEQPQDGRRLPEKEQLLKQMLPLSDLQPEAMAVMMDITIQQYLDSSKCYDVIYEQTRLCVRGAESQLKEPLDVCMIFSILLEERRRFETHPCPKLQL